LARRGALGGRRPSATALVIGAAALVAAAVAALELTRPGQLPGTSYDTGVYLGAAIRLVHGSVAYRDFAFVQPPGLVILLSPFGLLSEVVGTRRALDALILCTPLLAACNVVLVGRLVRHRGWRAALVACGLMALYPAMFFALLDGMVEPLMDLFCLVGLCLVFEGDTLAGRRRLALGGAAIGVAGTIMVSAVVPALIVVALCARHPRRRLMPVVGGLVAGFGILSLPFAILSPGGFFDGVVISQVARVPKAMRIPADLRLMDLAFGGGDTWALIAAAVIVVVVVAGLLVPPRRRLPALEGFAAGATLAMLAVQFVTSQYFPHYPAMVAPFLAILVGTSAGRLGSWRLPRVVPAATTLLAVWLLATQVMSVEAVTSVRVPGGVVAGVVPAGACALANRTYLLIASDRFNSSLPGCSQMVDTTGVRYADVDIPGGAVAAFRSAITHVDYVVVDMSLPTWLFGSAYAPIRAYVAGNFYVVRENRLYFYIRDGYPIASSSARP
jgi:alpha-1,2-mannosyltransferase